jgi:dihydroorotase
VLSALDEAIEKGWIRDEEVTIEALANFLGVRGRKFYQIPDSTGEEKRQTILLEKKRESIPESIVSADGKIEIVPFRAGNGIWSLTWKN